MNVIIAIALLILLLVHIGEKGRAAQDTQRKRQTDELGWIDEPELLDAATDDFV